MPLDRKGRKIRPGDIVVIPCIVKGIDKQSEFINLAVEPIESIYPGQLKQLIIVNARQTERIGNSGQSDPDLDVKAAIRQKTKEAEDSGILKGIPIPDGG